MIRTWAESSYRFSLFTARLFLIIYGVGRFSIWGVLVLTDYWWGYWGASHFQNYWEAWLAPTAPPPCSYAYVTCTYTFWNNEIIIIIKSLFSEDYILSTGTYLTYGPLNIKCPGRESIPCTSYWSPNHCSIIQLCTYRCLAAVGTLHCLFQPFYLQENILKWDVATIALSHLVRDYCTGRGDWCRKS